jgi:hypothetical protein
VGCEADPRTGVLGHPPIYALPVTKLVTTAIYLAVAAGMWWFLQVRTRILGTSVQIGMTKGTAKGKLATKSLVMLSLAR